MRSQGDVREGLKQTMIIRESRGGAQDEESVTAAATAAWVWAVHAYAGRLIAIASGWLRVSVVYGVQCRVLVRVYVVDDALAGACGGDRVRCTAAAIISYTVADEDD